jgi:hypothetical protein
LFNLRAEDEMLSETAGCIGWGNQDLEYFSGVGQLQFLAADTREQHW